MSIFWSDACTIEFVISVVSDSDACETVSFVSYVAVADISDDVGFERGTRKDTGFVSFVSLMGMDFSLPIKD